MVCILLALVLLARVGVGDGLTVSALGLLLCTAGLSQGEARADLWTLAPMTLYVLAAMLSSLAAYGSLFAGFGGVQLDGSLQARLEALRQSLAAATV